MPLTHSKIDQKGLVRAPFQFFTSREGYHNIIDMDQLAAKKIKEDNNDIVINDDTVSESVLSCRRDVVLQKPRRRFRSLAGAPALGSSVKGRIGCDVP